MVVSLHIFIAVISLLLVSYSLIKTSRKTIIVGYASVIFTIASGVYLVLAQPARMVHTCVAGLAYVAVAAAILAVAKIRFARIQHNEAL